MHLPHPACLLIPDTHLRMPPRKSHSSSCLSRRLPSSSLAFSFGCLLRLSHAAPYFFAFVWFHLVSSCLKRLFVLPRLVSSRVHSRLKSHGCCRRLGRRVALRHPLHPLFHTILFILPAHDLFPCGVRLTPGTAPLLYKPMHQSRRAACQLPCLPVLPCCLALGLWLGPLPRACCPEGETNRGPRWALSVLCSTSVLRSTSCLGAGRPRRVLNIPSHKGGQNLIARI